MNFIKGIIDLSFFFIFIFFYVEKQKKGFMHKTICKSKILSSNLTLALRLKLLTIKTKTLKLI